MNKSNKTRILQKFVSLFQKSRMFVCLLFWLVRGNPSPRSWLCTKNGPSLHLCKFFTPSGLKLPKKEKSYVEFLISIWQKFLKGKNEALYKRYKSSLVNCQTNIKPPGIICKNEGNGGPGGSKIFLCRNGLKMLFLSKMKIIIIGSNMVLDEPSWFWCGPTNLMIWSWHKI